VAITKKKRTVPANAIHPGEMLREEFMVPLGLTSYRLAKDLDLPLPRVNDIVREKRAISADTALRLGRYFRTSAQLWMNLQARYDLLIALANGKGLSKVKPRKEADSVA
jgi:antitoxin HigA-1